MHRTIMRVMWRTMGLFAWLLGTGASALELNNESVGALNLIKSTLGVSQGYALFEGVSSRGDDCSLQLNVNSTFAGLSLISEVNFNVDKNITFTINSSKVSCDRVEEWHGGPKPSIKSRHEGSATSGDFSVYETKMTISKAPHDLKVRMTQTINPEGGSPLILKLSCSKLVRIQ